MSITMEWIDRLPRTAFPSRAEDTGRSRAAVRPTAVLAGAAWLVQAVVLGFLAYHLLGGAATDLVAVIVGGSAGVLQIVLSISAVILPFLAAAGIAVLMRRDGASVPLTVAAMAATVLCAGLVLMGTTAVVMVLTAA